MDSINYFLNSKKYQVMKIHYEKTWFKLKGNQININEDDEFIIQKVSEITKYFINKNIKIKKYKKKTILNIDEEEDVETVSKNIVKSFF